MTDMTGTYYYLSVKQFSNKDRADNQILDLCNVPHALVKSVLENLAERGKFDFVIEVFETPLTDEMPITTLDDIAIPLSNMPDNG